MLSFRKYWLNNANTNATGNSADAGSNFDPLADLPDAPTQAAPGFAGDTFGIGLNNLSPFTLSSGGGSSDGSSPLAFLNNVTPADARLGASAAPNATFAPNGATPAQVRQALGDVGLSQTGAGVKVGVLSDSFNNLGGAAADESSGALPPAADIQVLADLASGGSDEGRAMMQIIHDIAPGAGLAFYTAVNSEQDFANGILALAAAGCKVICDDISYFDEPFFQNGIVAQAIQTVEAEGVVYLTAAGNNASNAYQAAWSAISGSFDGQTLTDAENFSGSLVQTVTLGATAAGLTAQLLLEW